MFDLPSYSNCKISVIGLGYVGLPLAIQFANIKESFKNKNKTDFQVLGFDISKKRVQQLKDGFDSNKEISKNDLITNNSITFTNDKNELFDSDVFIITVPTPIDKSKIPDLTFLQNASEMVGNILKKRNDINKNLGKFIIPIVIFESTVYPGATEEECIPIIEKFSGLKLNNVKNGFGCGYSPERINPGDKFHTVKDITKVTSGSNSEISDWVDNLYGSIIEAGTHKAESIKIAETAKVIENTQRDLNIALVNEIAIICNLLEIDTRKVIAAAGSKWNFQKFYPGLVGGHCIGVDPYYLTFKSKQLGYYPEVVLAGRKINDNMSKYISEQIVLKSIQRNIAINNSRLLLLGFSFKANCNDIRNTKVADLINHLQNYKFNIDVVDPLIDVELVKTKFNIDTYNKVDLKNKYSIIVLAVGHELFKKMKIKDWKKLATDNCLFVDMVGCIKDDLFPYRV